MSSRSSSGNSQGQNNPTPDRTTSTSGSVQSQSNGGRGGCGGRGRGRGRGPSSFKGQEPSLSNCTFNYAEEAQSKWYLKNIKLLVGSIGSHHTKYNLLFQRVIEQLDPQDQKPVDPPSNPKDIIQMEEWKLKYKECQEKV